MHYVTIASKARHPIATLAVAAMLLGVMSTDDAYATSNTGPRNEATHNVFGGPGGSIVAFQPGFRYALNMGSYHLGQSLLSRPGCCNITPGVIANRNIFNHYIPNSWFSGHFNQDGLSFQSGSFSVMPGHKNHPATFGNPQ